MTERTCVIGAGASGICAAKALHERGLPFDCFELGDRIGGNWVYGNSNGVSSSYRSLHINTSREKMEFSDFPMSKSLPDFPRHDHIAAYFEDYVDHFGFRDKIIFGTGVEKVERAPDGEGGYLVSTSDGEQRRYSHVVVCNGHHWDPRWPEPAFPGADTFEGEQMHAHFYKDEEQLRGKRVVVLGVGNSGMDIAVDASYHAEATYLAHRRGAYILPKYLFGKPIDQGAEILLKLPPSIRWRVVGAVLKLVQGSPEDFGMQKPDHRMGEAHPTVSGRILDRISHGSIVPKPNIAALEGSKVRFDDGSEVEADLVVYCTGYRITFPFFDPDWISAPDNRIDLYKFIFHPTEPGIYFTGFVQPLGAIMPISERQTKLIAEHVAGAYRLPPEPEMRSEIAATQAEMQKRYVTSKRHTIQVDFEPYMDDLQAALDSAAGAVRPAAAGV